MLKILSLSLYIASFISFGAGIILVQDVKNAVSDPDSYQFGSIKMLAQLGEAYRSLESYVEATLTTASLFFFCSLLLACFGSIMLFTGWNLKDKESLKLD
ncbi:MAG: hypothetical protein CME65_05785 [Halobacteriovoraceae bacterium]|nr:hypothetical protein [Halobacteriovoraceae bacterium]|tara:strand:- start:23312 stop:23611 length:300 start_codon:yes stop_codon:yes gene_type:complete